MDRYSYLEIKEDIRVIASETVAAGANKNGGIGRAMVEYWLDPEVLKNNEPTPHIVKLLAAAAICESVSTPLSDTKKQCIIAIEWLVSNIQAEEFSRINSSSELHELLCSLLDGVALEEYLHKAAYYL